MLIYSYAYRHFMKKEVIYGILTILLIGCTPQVIVQPAPTPEVPREIIIDVASTYIEGSACRNFDNNRTNASIDVLVDSNIRVTKQGRTTIYMPRISVILWEQLNSSVKTSDALLYDCWFRPLPFNVTIEGKTFSDQYYWPQDSFGDYRGRSQVCKSTSFNCGLDDYILHKYGD